MPLHCSIPLLGDDRGREGGSIVIAADMGSCCHLQSSAARAPILHSWTLFGFKMELGG